MGPHFLLASALISACPSSCRTASGSGLPASWELTLTLGQPPRGPSQWAWCCNSGDWEPPSPSARLTLPPHRHTSRYGSRRTFSAGERAGPSETPTYFQGPSRQNSWALTPTRQRSHLCPPLCSPHNPRIGPADLLGANSNPRSDPEGPIPRGLSPQRLGLRTPEPQPALTLPPRHHPGR